MPIVGGLDIHRKQITFDYLDTVTGEVRRGQITPADRARARLAGPVRWPRRRRVRGRRVYRVAICRRGARVLAARLYGVGPVTALAMTCWLAGAAGSPPPAR
jgi:transposase